MTKKPLVVGNWKMELSHKGAVELIRSLKRHLKGVEFGGDIVVCPSFPALPEVAAELKKSQRISVGAQTIHGEEHGPWTGQVSVSQIAPFVTWCILGHSEQRQVTGETDEEVSQKAILLLQHGISPIVCIGETAQDRQHDRTYAKITNQALTLFSRLTRVAVNRLVIAYEPIWAIGTGQLPDPRETDEVVLLIRKLAAGKFGGEAAQRMRILYGGSVKADNVGPYVAEPGIDGVLVGGASVRPMEFIGIIKQVRAQLGKS